ncbi:MAG: hypothetical protein QM692_23225 [Thermomicrobiales bacterium]
MCPPAQSSEAAEAGIDRESINRALAFAVSAAQRHGWDTVWVVTNPQGPRDRLEIEAHAYIRSLTGVRTGGVALRALTQPDLPHTHAPGVVLALFPTETLQTELDAVPWLHGLVIVPGGEPLDTAQRNGLRPS